MEKLNWYAFVTRSRYEKVCEKLLKAKGFEVFLPLQKVSRKWSDRIKEIEKPLISGYIFVRIDNKFKFDVLNTEGVARIISFNNIDAIIPEKDITNIKNLLSFSNNIETIDLGLEIGKEIKITSGPLKGLKGKLLKIKNKGKIIIEIESIGKGIIVEISDYKFSEV